MCNYFSSELNSSKIITDNKNLLEDDFRAEYFFFCKFLTIFSETIKMTPKLGLTINVTKYVPVLSKILEISNIPMLVVKISLVIKDILLHSTFDPNTEPLKSVTLQSIQKLLDPMQNEYMSLFVGNLVMTFFYKVYFF